MSFSSIRGRESRPPLSVFEAAAKQMNNEYSSRNMKTIIALCLIATNCTLQVPASNPLDHLKNTLGKSKNNVNSIITDLRRTRDNLDFSTTNKLLTLQSQSMSNINNFVNPALTELRANVDAAKTQGKDVEHCYTTAKDSLKSITSTAFTELKTCETNARQLLQLKLNALDASLATGQKSLTALNNVFLDCYQSNIMRMSSCIAIKLGQINQSIKLYESEVNTLKRNAERGVNDTYLSAYSCNMKPVSKARSEATDVRIATSKCIKNYYL